MIERFVDMETDWSDMDITWLQGDMKNHRTAMEFHTKSDQGSPEARWSQIQQLFLPGVFSPGELHQLSNICKGCVWQLVDPRELFDDWIQGPCHRGQNQADYFFAKTELKQETKDDPDTANKRKYKSQLLKEAGAVSVSQALEKRITCL